VGENFREMLDIPKSQELINFVVPIGDDTLGRILSTRDYRDSKKFQ